MRSLILLGCVLFASACDVVAPEDATTVRIVEVAHPSTRNDPFLLRIQNIGIAGSYHAVGYTGYESSTSSTSSSTRWTFTERCSQVPTAIEANTTINTQLPGCGVNRVDWIVIETMEQGSSGWTRTACYAAGTRACPSDLARER